MNIKNLFLLICLAILLINPPSTHSAGTSDVVLHKDNLQYLGAFRMPRGESFFSWSSGTIAYNKNNNSLFIVGSNIAPNSNSNNYVAEISIPVDLVNSTNVSSLPISSMIQPFADITEGHQHEIGSGGAQTGSNGVHIGGLLVHNNKLIGTAYSYYDASQSAIRSHFSSSTNLSVTGDFKGMYQVGTTPEPVPQAGFIAGYMSDIPSAWQDDLGGTALTGQAGIPIISRTSYGPAAFSFNPDHLGSGSLGTETNPVMATGLVYYPMGHWTLGSWSTNSPSNEYISIGDNFTGVVFPVGSKSILFFGRHGAKNCYGPGTSKPEEDGNTTGMSCEGGTIPEGDYCCYDPFNVYTKGTHGYPFKAYVWAYNADDLAQVKNGTKKPWDIIPYDVWDFTIPTTSYNGVEREIFIGGAAYDPIHQRIFVTQNNIEGNYDLSPIVHVFQITGIGPQEPKPDIIHIDIQ